MFITILTYVLMVVEAVVCLLLIGVILLQRSKGQGMGLAFGGGVGESLFGANMGNVLTKTTVVLAIIFLINTAVLAYLGASGKERSIADNIIGGAPAPVAPTEQPLGPIDTDGIEQEVPIPAPEGAVTIPEPVSIPSPAVTAESAPVEIPAAPVEMPVTPVQ